MTRYRLLQSWLASSTAVLCVISLALLGGVAEGFLSASGTCGALARAAARGRLNGRCRLHMLEGCTGMDDSRRQNEPQQAAGTNTREERRKVLFAVATAASVWAMPVVGAEPCRTAACDTLVIPLQACGGSYCLQYLIDNRGCVRRALARLRMCRTVAS